MFTVTVMKIVRAYGQCFKVSFLFLFSFCLLLVYFSSCLYRVSLCSVFYVYTAIWAELTEINLMMMMTMMMMMIVLW